MEKRYLGIQPDGCKARRCKHFGVKVGSPRRVWVAFLDGSGRKDSEELHWEVEREAPLLGTQMHLCLWKTSREWSHEDLYTAAPMFICYSDFSRCDALLLAVKKAVKSIVMKIFVCSG